MSSQELATGNFKLYEHAAFRVSYPASWQIVGDPKSALTLYPKGGADQQTVAYGAIISGFSPGRGGKELDEAMRQLISSIRDTNPALSPSGHPVNISIGGKPAKSVEMLGNSAIREKNQAIPERIRLVALPGKGNVVLYMVFVAPDADFDRLRPTFDRMMRSFTAR